ncbi:nucleoside-diphosphate sugar epimerase [Kaistia algarum]|uniref:SDR family oxidoreductase n=1 Tax=Kaistia algarum TaxID=2083279 RepID=UPI000CE8AD9B|nr:NmrA family NAD(P)-binding protein [Kaistia algarum]MCX5512037.1 NmrA family NAD(P)-binding protein [Kaistia algarum]PPE80162.1 nucleoside-diphosphate sugar epimerase [Kaistia algarum]
MSVVDSSRSVLVYLANGVQGGAVVRAALCSGFKVRALVRDRGGSHALAARDVELVEGDLRDPTALLAASAGVGHAVLQVPIGPADQMLTMAANAVTASRAAGLRSIALKLASASRPAPCAEPSFIANAQIEHLVRSEGPPFAVVRPTLYLDNLLKPSARADIVGDGVFSPPIDASQRIAWTSADDCAAAAMALLDRGVDGGDHLIAGPESVTGDELAARISTGLGRPVVYRAQPLTEFESEIDAVMGQGMGRRVASKFHFFAGQKREADAMLSVAFEASGALAGFEPSSIEAWVRRHRQDFLAPVHPERAAG